MVSQDAILRILVAQSEPVSPEFICSRLAPGKPCAPRTHLRRRVIVALSRLMASKFAQSHRTSSTTSGLKATYVATKAGRAFIADGGNLNRVERCCGPKHHTKSPKPGSIKQRLWSALRLRQKATLPELVELVHQKGDPAPERIHVNAQVYMRQLFRAGIVVAMAKLVPNGRHGSRGDLKYSLVRDLGPLAPSGGRTSTYDPNSRKRIPFVEASDV